MQILTFRSNVLEKIDCDQDHHTLRVWWRTGTTKSYVEVPDEVFEELLASASKEHYVLTRVRQLCRRGG